MRGNMVAERARRGMTREQAARVIGVSPQTLLRWEHGTRTPRGDKLEELADYYGVSSKYLLEDTPERESA